MNIEVELRNIETEDLPTFFMHQNEPLANQMAAFPARQRHDFMSRWKKILDDEGIAKQTILFNGQTAGNLVCFEISGKHQVGYWLGREFWGKGIATRALAMFLSVVPFRPLYAYVAVHNFASQRVLEKCNFHRIGEEGEEIIYQLERSDFSSISISMQIT